MLKIKAFPRIHISLIGMNNDGYRLNGGIGFSIASPTLEVCFEPSCSIEVIDKRDHGFTLCELDRLKRYLHEIAQKEKFDTVFRCIIHEGMIQSHVGFGSNSMIYLSCIEALLMLNQRSYNQKDVITLSGRGGTSGIGINTYFNGGFIFDAGISNFGQRSLAPSSVFVGEMVQSPLLLKELRLPQWDLGVCIPPIAPKSEDEEREFFQENCPINKDAVALILYEVVYGVTTSLMEGDYNTFCKSIDVIQQTKWKLLERNLYGKELITAETLIRKAGARCVGMSSLGPMLFFFGNDIDSIVNRVNVDLTEGKCFKTSFNNSSRILEYD